MKEISRRSMYHLDEGIACGPVSISSIDAEIAVEKDGKTIYLHAQWVDAAGDEIYYQATGESVYECYKNIFENEDEDREEDLIEAKEKAEETELEDEPWFEPFYEELKQMIYQEMRDNDLKECIDELEGFDDDEQEDEE